MAQASEVTQLLLAWGEGDEVARDRLLPLVYDELRRLARNHMRRERPDHTLQTSALIHEAFLRIIEQTVSWQSRAHFFGIAARLMRQVLVNHAATRGRLKRGGADQQQISLTAAAEVAAEPAVEILALDEALKSPAALDERKSRIVELRFFGGLTNEEIAEVMEISLSTVEREWRLAKAWLQCELERH